ncbi:hypothetical protein [Cupriavidus necator]|uniref:hypothetical protein n=1 Tax=Cupriavidus necator TaxID=106590 RepID=UPI0012D35848|nr:hypothetical protein [Cupriavidus necator]
MNDLDAREGFAFECHIRDFYAANLKRYKPGHLVSQREVTYKTSRIRADLRTVDQHDVIFEWEFKIEADYSSIGQIMAYTAHAKVEFNFNRTVRSVIAAFEFPDEIRMAIEVNNLGIEMVRLPGAIRNAGHVPSLLTNPAVLEIPSLK